MKQAAAEEARSCGKSPQKPETFRQKDRMRTVL